MNDQTSRVKQQYMDWPFPKPIADIDEWKAGGGGSLLNISLDHDFLWPDKAFDPKISILVAGCGTLEAALQAYENPSASVTGIDISTNSLDAQQKLKTKHRLDNLDLIQMDLNDVAQLNRKFDFIVCSGVLHHLMNPEKGFAALSSALNDDGVIFVMVYNKQLRDGFFRIRDGLNSLNVGQTPKDVAFAREALKEVPPWHPAYPLIHNMDDLSSDEGLVDAVLHKQERGYYVSEILDLAAGCDLCFQGWFDNLHYYPEGAIQRPSELSRRISALPDQEQWSVVDRIIGIPADHIFMLKKERNNQLFSIPDFAAETFLKAVPVPRRTLEISVDEFGQTNLRREGRLWKIRGVEQALLSNVDGKLSIAEISARQMKGSKEDNLKACSFFRTMRRTGHFAMRTA